MTVRAANRNDARMIQGLLVDYFSRLDPNYRRTFAQIRDRMRDPNVITWVDTTGAYCEIEIHRGAQELEVSALYPRGRSRINLQPLLRQTLRAVLGNRPNLGPRRIFATFDRAVNAAGVPDRGRSECLAWQQLYPGVTVQQRADGVWEAFWSLSEAART